MISINFARDSGDGGDDSYDFEMASMEEMICEVISGYWVWSVRTFSTCVLVVLGIWVLMSKNRYCCCEEEVIGRNEEAFVYDCVPPNVQILLSIPDGFPCMIFSASKAWVLMDSFVG